MPRNRRSPCLIALSLFTACGAPAPDAPGDAAPPDGSGLPDGASDGGDPPRRVGDTVALTTTGSLVSFDRSAPGTLLTNVVPGWFARDERVVAIDMRPRDRALYALTNRGQLYVVDLGWGLARHLLQVTGPVGAGVEIDFDPVLDRLHVVSGDGTRLVVDVDAGHVDTVTDTALAGIAFANNFASACRSTQYVIDPAGDLQVIRGTAATRIGALGLGATHVAFDIATDSAGADAAFAADGAGFYAVDLATGHASLREVVPLPAGEAITGLALAVADVAPAQPPGELLGITASHRLVTFPQAVPAKLCTSAPIAGLGSGEAIVGFDAQPSTGRLYVVTSSAAAARVYRLDEATATASDPRVVAQSLAGARFGASFDPVAPDVLRIISDAGQNLRFDLGSGIATVDAALHGVTTTAVAAAYTDAVPAAGTSTLYLIDAAGRLRIATSPTAGTVADVGPLGIAASGLTAFEIDGEDNTALLAVASATDATTLYRVGLADGHATMLGVVGGGEPLRGLTQRTPTTTVFGLTADGKLVTVALDATTSVTVVGTISGLAPGDTLVGIDVRPSTGILYGVGRTGAIYALDRDTAAATQVSVLDGAALDGSEHGVAFDPTGTGALRLVSNTRQNLRVPEVSSGAAITEAPLARAARTYAITALAFSHNDDTGLPPTEFGFDATTNKLVTIVPPASGHVREIGRDPGPSIFRKAGFEIIGASTALTVEGDFSRTLLEVDLATGATTPVGVIAFSPPEGVPIINVVGLAAAPSQVTPAADSPVFAVDTGQRLIRFPRNAPGEAVNLGLLGIAPDDFIVGIDVQPATGELWIVGQGVLTQEAHLYTVVPPANPSVFLPVTLRSTLADASGPISLGFGRVGTDFEPTGRRFLRVVTADGRNLLVNPDTGFTRTDTPIGVAALEIGAAAYANSYAGASSTRLYAIDRASTSLVVVPDPATGTAMPVGALSPSFEYAGAAAFDIAGGNNGVALVALQLVSDPPASPVSQSVLYRIDLTTGAATQLGDGIDGAALAGLAIDIRPR